MRPCRETTTGWSFPLVIHYSGGVVIAGLSMEDFNPPKEAIRSYYSIDKSLLQVPQGPEGSNEMQPAPLPMSDEAGKKEMTLNKDNTQKHLQEDDVFMDHIPSIGDLRACIPKECFEKSTANSIGYLLIDFLLIIGIYYVEPYFEYFSYPGMIVWYFFAGLMVFTMFAIGHDCGHGTFSEYGWVNDVFGHISHGIVFTPFWPWQKSHRQHHMFTSHADKDRSHPWIRESVYNTWGDKEKFYANNNITLIIRWFFYTILGIPDGSHFWPGSDMFTNTKERIQCVVSVAVCFAWAYVAYWFLDYDLHKFIKFYVLPVVGHGFWLTMVTYLQHHNDDVKIWEEGRWGYVKGQLSTIDRTYGFGIDEVTHHLTDGHVAHHLFFTSIPHYHLMKATYAIQNKLEPLGLYRKIKSRDFLWQLLSLDRRLKYLLGEGTGLLRYAVYFGKSKDE